MPNLSDLFVNLQNSQAKFLGATSGEEFEDRVKVGLDSLGFNRITRSDLDDNVFSQIKKRANAHFHAGNIKNPTNYQAHYIQKPFGSQDYPDFLVFYGCRIVCIETKFSTGNQKKPMWNSGLPRQHGIYIFGSYGEKDITFFMGRDVLSKNEAKSAHKFFANLKTLEEDFNKGMSNQEYGFTVYTRKAFDQKKKHNENAKLNFFSNPDRNTLEAEVIDFTKP
ncbi:MAG: hypothetical protein MJE68_21610 [Proteobacteria bacterium]|nr:hypothetical protein [Pseudomonadota bacterium]